MNALSKIAMATLGLAFASTLFVGTPAFAQGSAPTAGPSNDAFSGGSNYQTNTPQLQGATNGTIGPQGADATVFRGKHRRNSSR